MRCGRCQSSVPDDARYCPACGAAQSPADASTHTSDGQARSRDRMPGGGRLGDAARSGHTRFPPGTMLQDRYRIVGLLGRGGMGEVYRADDLRLDQVVALKFLPAAVARDPERLAQLHAEVRTAREVSHPNVCRVYDIGEADGDLFLTMEFVDGEDLAATLRRLGRLPEDRAVEIARELGAGLAAAHARGVVHRDLKPSNIMIDGAGAVRVMDFGLAIIGSAAGVRAGTPAYMAPEQIADRQASPQSDIYAYGLVLYELFTGRRAHRVTTIADLIVAHESDRITPPRVVVPGLDPGIERAILRCLARDPARRPASALAVVALLPGGDPLAAALAAGQTPSPEMVAAAGERAGAVMTRTGGVAAIGALAVLLMVVAGLADRGSVAGQSTLRKPAPVLAEYARQVRDAAGLPPAAAFEAWGFDYDRDALRGYGERAGARERWARLVDEVPAVRFWYRSSARPLTPRNPLGAISPADPPMAAAGDALVELDVSARLLRLHAWPSGATGPAPSNPPRVDWSRLFAAADLNAAALAPAPLTSPPPVFADEVLSWTGDAGSGREATIRVNAASAAGRPVWFEVVGPWTDAPAPSSSAALTAEAISAVLSAGLVLVTMWLAVVNLREDRADREGAFRVAAVAFAIYLLRWAILPAHQADPPAELPRLFASLGYGLLFGVVLGGAYLGLEPFVRRHWPHALVGWTRLLTGQWRDPVVGRDVLVGLVAGLAGATVTYGYVVTPMWLGRAAPAGWLLPLAPAEGLAPALAGVLFTVNWSLVNGLLAMFIVAVIRRWIRPGWAVALLAMAAFALLAEPETHLAVGQPGLFAALGLMTLPGIVVLFRYGLLAGVASALSSNLTANMIFTLDPSRGYFQASLLQAGLIAGLGAIGWRLARRP